MNGVCAGGTGSFIDQMAALLQTGAAGLNEAAKEALFSKAPVDIGTRCTVFMNSNVKQAQKEGALVSDISAGLAYSVIKNALYKVIKLVSVDDLGSHIVVQGGTFHNQAVLRAFEKIAGVNAICPDISGLMGAFGAVLVARRHYSGQESRMICLDDILTLSYTSSSVPCDGCANNCMLTINKFSGGRKHVSGNRCEREAGGAVKRDDSKNMVVFKRNAIFGVESLEEKEAYRGTVGIPRVLNIYKNYPFWATFFKELGFRVVLSPFSDRKIYELGMESIPSESECYPAKLAHGHVQWLVDQGIKTIFHPCVFYENKETQGAQNQFNCPIVVSYAENLKNNVEAITSGDVRYIRPFIAFTSEVTASERLVRTAKEEWGISGDEVRRAASKAWKKQQAVRESIRAEGERQLEDMKANNARGIVLAGRPYHIDPEINHGIAELISSFGLYVFTEDSIPQRFESQRPLRVVDQWVYHSRLYTAAQYVCTRDDLELIQLNSFGCGLDAVTTDQVAEILENSNKLYTLLKIDEVNNLGAVRIRIRSLLAAMDMRREMHVESSKNNETYVRREFTRDMFQQGYTILAPQMSPIHFDILEPVFKKHGYNIVLLDNDNREAIDTGLKFVNNDACFPAITVVGQIMQAILSGEYDTDKLAVMMTQTGGCCRASNYVAFIRRALEKAGLEHIPVISLNANGMEKNEGFRIKPALLIDAGMSIVYGDLLMRCVYRVRPYELVQGSTNELHAKWRDRCIESLLSSNSVSHYKHLCHDIVADFDSLPINEEHKKRPELALWEKYLSSICPLLITTLLSFLNVKALRLLCLTL